MKPIQAILGNKGLVVWNEHFELSVFPASRWFAKDKRVVVMCRIGFSWRPIQP